MIYHIMAAAQLGLQSAFIQISALVGVALPLLVAVVQRARWPQWVRVAVAVASSLVAALVTAAAQGKLNVHDYIGSAIVIFMLSKTTYLAVWKPAGVAPAIEHATTPAPNLRE